MATSKTDEAAPLPAGPQTGGEEPSSHDTCGQFPADEVKATFPE